MMMHREPLGLLYKALHIDSFSGINVTTASPSQDWNRSCLRVIVPIQAFNIDLAHSLSVQKNTAHFVPPIILMSLLL